MKNRACFLICFLMVGALFGQAPKAFRDLVLPVDSFISDIPRREQILDLVQVWSADSVITKARQRHKIPVAGALGSLFGANWRFIDAHKKKYIGTNSRSFKVFRGVAGEVDLNIFLTPHLAPYVRMVKDAYEETAPGKRQIKHWRRDQPPYSCAEELNTGEGKYLTVECECTPLASHREELQEKFLPTAPGSHPLQEHPNFGVKYPSMGTYGVWCYDCNHSCRPEIHPFEWIWWNDLSREHHNYLPGGRIWYFAAMRDDTRRFNDWSPGPLKGGIAIPFYLPPQTELLSANLQLISHDEFAPEDFPGEPLFLEKSAPVLKRSQKLSLPLSGEGPQRVIEFRSDKDLPAEAVRIQLLDVRHDPETGEVWGRLELRLSVESLLAAKLTLWPVP